MIWMSGRWLWEPLREVKGFSIRNLEVQDLRDLKVKEEEEKEKKVEVVSGLEVAV